jgi:tetratricopeptide (TPR) repeat protein
MGFLIFIAEALRRDRRDSSRHFGLLHPPNWRRSHGRPAAISRHLHRLTTLKAIGNEHFRQGRHLDAIDYYTDAIEAAPYDEAGPTGVELLRLKLEFEEAQREARAERHRFEMEKCDAEAHTMTTAKRTTNKPMWGS